MDFDLEKITEYAFYSLPTPVKYDSWEGVEFENLTEYEKRLWYGYITQLFMKTIFDNLLQSQMENKDLQLKYIVNKDLNEELLSNSEKEIERLKKKIKEGLK